MEMRGETGNYVSIGCCPQGMCDLHEQFRAMVEAFDGFIYVCSRDYRIEFMNRKLIERTGYDATGEFCFKVMNGRDSICPWCANERVFKGENVSWEMLSPRDNRWYYVVNTPVYHVDGSVSKQSMIMDITERKRAEEASLESEEKYRTLVECSSDAIMMADKDRKIISCNRAFLKLFGLKMDEATGKSARILHATDESFRLFGEKIEEAARNGGSLVTEWELIRKDGTVLPTEQALSLIRDPDGTIKGRVNIIRDITKRKKTERELAEYRTHLEEMVEKRTRDLEEAQSALIHREKLKTLGAISAELAHEIRNPLTSIGGFASRLQKKFPDLQEAGIILKESRRLEKLLDRISNYLRPVAIRYQECSISTLISDVLKLLSRELDDHGIKREVELRSDLPPVYLDPAIFSQVVVNVLRNCMEMIDNSRALTLKTFESDQRVHVHFRIPDKAQTMSNPELLFLPFNESERLMVSFATRLIDAMGGSLTFAQEQNYMVFVISVPKALPESAESLSA
jgi:PAS domain S-box-containing protein